MHIAVQILLYILGLPTNLAGWIVISIAGAAWGDGLRWKDGVLTTAFKPDSWPMKTWFKNWGGTTIGHAIWTAPNMPEAVWQHEMIHVSQNQRASILGTVLGLIAFGAGLANWWLPLILWVFMPAASYLCAGLLAVMKGKSFYMANIDEMAAYSGAGQS